VLVIPRSVRPSLLFVSPRFLLPIDQGGKIRTCGILRGLKGGRFEIVLAAPAPAGADAYAAEIATLCDRFVAWPEPRGGRLRKLAALAGRLPVSVAGDVSASGRAVVAAALATRPDLVVVDFPHAAVLLPETIDCPAVMFTHNIEAEIFARHAAVATPLWRPVWQRQARLMQAFEGAVLPRFETVIAVSRRDADELRRRYGLARLASIDTGVDLGFYAFDPPTPGPGSDGGTVVFCGSMDSHSNIDGTGFLMDEVWPQVTAARPAAQALIVGRNPPASLVAKAARRGLRWRFTGFVDDIRPYVSQGEVSVIPLRVGSGTRLKAFEAMALGRPVVSTGLGVEGLGVTAEEHYLRADTAKDFAAAILRLLADAALRGRIATAARGLLEANFSWQQVAQQFEAICLRTLEQAGRQDPCVTGEPSIRSMHP
jgi:glycosyltransferase involved in cell wall biosynthesis